MTPEFVLDNPIPQSFNWNSELHLDSPVPESIPAEPSIDQLKTIELVSECRRDGIQGINFYPDDKESMDYLVSLDKLGITRTTIGIYPGNNQLVDNSTMYLLDRMRILTPNSTPILLSLTTEASTDWILRCQEVNPAVEAIVFMGTSPARLFVENWSREEILDKLSLATAKLTNAGVKVLGATEHTTETQPEFLKQIIETVVNSGATSFCVADTIGIARPKGAYRITKFVKETLDKLNRSDVLIEWHGHRDLGNDLGNAMAAISAGANRIHVVSRGIGERAGNTQLETVMLNIAQIQSENGVKTQWNLEMLDKVLRQYDTLIQIDTPKHGVLGSHNFETRSGLHTAAMYKAEKLATLARESGDLTSLLQLEQLSRSVYSALDPHTVGRTHEIKISPLSGAASVRYAYQRCGGDVSTLPVELINTVLEYANRVGRDLTDDELRQLFFA